MIDPKESSDSKKEENETDSSAENNGGNASSDSQWDEHMQIDEEGNEVSPEDQ